MRAATKTRLGKLAAAAAGIVAAWSMSEALAPALKPQWPTAAPARVSFKAAPAPEPVTAKQAESPVPTDAVLPLRVPDAPPPVAKPKKIPSNAANSAVASTQTSPVLPEQEVSPVLPAQTFPDLVQPALPGQLAEKSTGGIPLLGQTPADASAPPVPSAVPEFRSVLAQFEKPGADVVVVAVLVNDQGVVVDSFIVVPSRYPLNDLTATFTQIGKQWTAIDPPMVPGEFRWFELRIDQLLALRRDALIP